MCLVVISSANTSRPNPNRSLSAATSLILGAIPDRVTATNTASTISLEIASGAFSMVAP